MLSARVPNVCKQVVRHSSHFTGSVVSGPPTVRIPFIEKVVVGGGMVASMLVVPAWVLCNIKNYRAR